MLIFFGLIALLQGNTVETEEDTEEVAETETEEDSTDVTETETETADNGTKTVTNADGTKHVDKFDKDGRCYVSEDRNAKGQLSIATHYNTDGTSHLDKFGEDGKLI